jgi:hypothetical protein
MTINRFSVQVPPLLQRAALQTQANRYAYLQRQIAVKLVQTVTNS